MTALTEGTLSHPMTRLCLVTIPTDAPPGFAEAIEAGDLAFHDGHLVEAANAWAAARCLAEQLTGHAWLGCANPANVRLEVLLALCTEPGLVPERSFSERDRWAALRAAAEGRVLAPAFATTVMRLASMLRPADGAYPSVVRRSKRAWSVLMACNPLVPGAFECIDHCLIAEGMHRQRAELARHPWANPEVWIGMLTRCRTDDLVHTLWELPEAMKSDEVRQAVGAPASSESPEDDDGEE